MNVSAAGGHVEGSHLESITFKATIAVENENVPTPEVTFKYSKALPAVPSGTTDANGAPVYRGVFDAVNFDQTRITFAPGDPLTKEGTITFNTAKFTHVGIYRYLIKQTAGSDEGFTYDTSEYYLDVYVGNDETNGGYEVYAVNSFKKDAPETKADIEFVNEYESRYVTFTNINRGNMANLGMDFEYYVTINGPEGKTYTLIDKNNNARTITAGTRTWLSLGNKESATIYGLTDEDTYTIESTDFPGKDSYVTTITGADRTEGLTAYGDVIGGSDSVTFTNVKELPPATGIVLTYGPYARTIPVAGGSSYIWTICSSYSRSSASWSSFLTQEE